MTRSWDSLYLPFADSAVVAETLRQTLASLGYTLYNPFGLLPGRSYPQSVRLFVAPPADGWVRIVGTPDPRLMLPLAFNAPCLYLGLEGEEALIEVYAPGGRTQAEVVLLPYLRAPHTADDLRRALYEAPSADGSRGQTPAVMPLPDDVQAMAGQVDSRQAQAMFQRLSGNLLRKTGADAATAQAAQELIQPPDWNSPGARRIAALVDCLTMPKNWRDPDFVSLRDAYQLHVRRQRKPDARLYPGDEDIMNRVPDALDYIPVYGGREN